MLQSITTQMNIANTALQGQSGFVCAGFVADDAKAGYVFDAKNMTPGYPTNKEERDRRT